MAQHTAKISWERGDARFTDNKYSRVHQWSFDGGVTIKGSPSPHVVPKPYSDASAVDPEEAFVASLSACHMLTFLWIAAKAGYTVDSYDDEAEGTLAKNGEERLAITEVILRPRVRFSGDKTPSKAELDELHHGAHEGCFIANSVKTLVRCEPVA